MISNERSWPHLRRPAPGKVYRQPDYQQPFRPPVPEDTLKTGDIQIERKFFTFTLKENDKGRFLRITEDTGGKRSTIIIPSTGLEDFQRTVSEMVSAAEQLPAPAKTPPAADEDSLGNH